jgi:hypothetical protein
MASGRFLSVRAIFGISCILLGVLWLMCRVEGPIRAQIAKPQAASRWVRTVDGWERPDSWTLVTAPGPTLHPLVIAAGQGLVSVFGLLLFQRDER